eukprot:1151787-Pelagomonas_calceolata.AAC.2
MAPTSWVCRPTEAHLMQRMISALKRSGSSSVAIRSSSLIGMVATSPWLSWAQGNSLAGWVHTRWQTVLPKCQADLFDSHRKYKGLMGIERQFFGKK